MPDAPGSAAIEPGTLTCRIRDPPPRSRSLPWPARDGRTTGVAGGNPRSGAAALSVPFCTQEGIGVCHACKVAAKQSAVSLRRVPFDAQAFLDSAGISRTVVRYLPGNVIFQQGDACAHVMYIQSGAVKLSVLSKAGREAVVAMLGPGDFFGEGCLAGQRVRMGSATATAPSAILQVRRERMARLLHKQHAMSDRFISHMLARNIRIEEDLIDQLFNSSEKRLARTLLLLARYGKHETPSRAVPKISQETLAEMIGTTRSRVNFFLNKFKRLGFIEYSGDLPLTINHSLLSVVLHDD
jgi:CRP/FNR family transcriptional regulator, cyclic AMP receptor protein